MKRTLASFGAATLVLALATPADAATKPAWHIVHTNTAKSVGSDTNTLNDIAAISSKDVWTVGDVERNGGGLDVGIAQHFNGKKWTSPKLPSPFRKSNSPNKSNALRVVAASSAHHVWAFGRAGSHYQYALAWNGKKWTVQHRWNTYEGIDHAIALSKSDVWVFGGGVPGSDPFGTWHFNGKKWSKVKTPGFSILSASAHSAKDIWAVVTKPTTHSDDGRFAAHYNGKTWKLVPMPDIPGKDQDTPDYATVHTISATSAWIAGGRRISTGAGGQDYVLPIALHWNGKTWKRYDGPRGQHTFANLTSVAPDGTGGIWATRDGDYDGDIVHLAKGTWATSKLPKLKGKTTAVSQLAAIPHSHTLLAVGALVWGGYPATNGIVLRYPH